MQRGRNEQRAAVAQHYRTSVLDSSLLRMPSVGFITPHDPM
jgi:GH15 family glucan-1,4-alpha-glucosidase